MTSGSEHAEYIFTRDKKLKDDLANSNTNTRLVPEMSGKRTEISNTVSNNVSVEASNSDSEVDYNSETIIESIRSMKTKMTSDEIDEAVQILHEDKSHSNTLSLILVGVIAAIAGFGIGRKSAPPKYSGD